MSVPSIATLVSAPHNHVSDAFIKRAAQVLDRAVAITTIDDGKAVDLTFIANNALDLRDCRDLLIAVCEPGSCDVIVQPTAHRRKRLFIADMDSTMIGQECIDCT